MSDTPKTDAAQLQDSHAYNVVRRNGWDFARGLERELTAANQRIAELTDAINEMPYRYFDIFDECNALKAENERLREALRELAKGNHDTKRDTVSR